MAVTQDRGEPLLYTRLVSWYRLVDPPADHLEEAQTYQAAFERAMPHAGTLLELGAGAGHNALHLKRRYRCTLTDVSAPMLELSRALNPECEHLLGDMRTLRLDRTFDVVLVHDAVMYMTATAELEAAIRTAFAHTTPGGAAIFAPDCVRESFRETTAVLEGAEGGRALRGLEWSWDPDPSDTLYSVEYCFLLRQGSVVEAVHDRHLEGLFARDTWLELCAAAGYEPEALSRPVGDGTWDEVFVCRRPPTSAA